MKVCLSCSLQSIVVKPTVMYCLKIIPSSMVFDWSGFPSEHYVEAWCRKAAFDTVVHHGNCLVGFM